MGELAPRDVVSRAIVEQIRKTHFTHVYLDVRHLPIQQFRERFPQLAMLTDEFDIDVEQGTDPRSSRGALHDRRRGCGPHAAEPA